MLRPRFKIVLLMVCLLAACKMRPPEKRNDVMNLIVTYNQAGRHDDAIKVAQDWMKNHPDDLLYDQIAITYLMKASKDSAHKDQWIQQAIVNYEKDLSTRKKATVDVELYEVGRGFEYAGDLSSHDSCLYYSRAMKAFVEEVQFIQGDSYTAYGHTTRLAPVRQENQKALERVKSKFDRAGCKAESSQSSSPV